jgi:hypothetical protein
MGALRSVFVVLVLASVAACGSTAAIVDGADGATDAATGDGGRDGAADGGGDAPSGTRTWMKHPCGNGDPVGCVFTNPVDIPDPTFALCRASGATEGKACTGADDRCVLVPAQREADGGGCTASANYLHCRSEPFAVGGCPVSSRTKKTDVHYLDEAERDALVREITSLRLASYRYTDDPEMGVTTGFILEDSPDASFVMKQRGRVNEHGYVGALVATIQAQQASIRRLEARVEELGRTCRAPGKR